MTERQRLRWTQAELERLACVGSDGMGALVYEPEDELAEEVAECDLSALAQSAMAFAAEQAD